MKKILWFFYPDKYLKDIKRYLFCKTFENDKIINFIPNLTIEEMYTKDLGVVSFWFNNKELSTKTTSFFTVYWYILKIKLFFMKLRKKFSIL